MKHRPITWPMLGVMIASILLLGATLFPQKAPLIIWNASSSVPIGFYKLVRKERWQTSIKQGDFILFKLDGVIRTIAHERRYIPAHIPLIKKIAALPGDYVCSQNDELIVHHAQSVQQQRKDSRGRELMAWHGCRSLAPDEYIVLGDNPHSFDSRYFGPLTQAQIFGIYEPL